MKGCLFSSALMLAAGSAVAADTPEPWFESAADETTAAVNEGDLRLLVSPPTQRVLHTRHRLTLNRDSLKSGWVTLHQCQGNLDPVTVVEIVYRYSDIRRLRVLSSQGIEQAWVEDSSVQLRQLSPQAEVCIGAEVRLLKPIGQGHYELHSGPFHRRFLDGYYPLRLDYQLSYPPDLLELVEVEPAVQAGFTVTQQPGVLAIDTLFEGKLVIRVRLKLPLTR